MQDRSPIMTPEPDEISTLKKQSDSKSITDTSPHEAIDPAGSNSNCSKYLATGAQVILATIGLGAGALYFGPAQSCANIDKCGKWLSELTGRGFAVGVLTAGGLDFSGGAAYMAADSGKATVNFIAKQPNLAAKIGMGSFVIVFGAAQIIPLLLTSLRTSTAIWQTILTVGGATPGSVFGTIHLTEELIPYYLSQIKKQASIAHHRMLDYCSPLSEVEKQEWAELSHFRKQHSAFLEQMHARYRYALENSSTVNISEHEDPLTFLFSDKIIPHQQSGLEKGVHQFGVLAGLLLAADFSAGGISNTFHLLSKYIPSLPLQILTTTILSASGLYANAKLTVHGVTAVLDGLMDIAQGKPLHSFIYQLRPKTSSLVTTASLSACIVSYAVIATLYINEFDPDPNKGNKIVNAGLYGAMAGINIYHFASLLHLYLLTYSRVTPDQQLQAHFRLEKEIERFDNMPEHVMKRLIAENPEKFLRLGFTPGPGHSDIEAPVVVEATEHTPLTSSSEKKKSALSSLFGVFSGKKEDAPVSDITIRQNYSALS